MAERLNLDGPLRIARILPGERTTMSPSDEPLSILGFRHVG